jgi:hypothetical protein
LAIKWLAKMGDWAERAKFRGNRSMKLTAWIFDRRVGPSQAAGGESKPKKATLFPC